MLRRGRRRHCGCRCWCCQPVAGRPYYKIDAAQGEVIDEAGEAATVIFTGDLKGVGDAGLAVVDEGEIGEGGEVGRGGAGVGEGCSGHLDDGAGTKVTEPAGPSWREVETVMLQAELVTLKVPVGNLRRQSGFRVQGPPLMA